MPKHGQSINFSQKISLPFIRFVFSTISIQNYNTTNVIPTLLSKISKFINLYKNSSDHLSSFTIRVPHWKTQAAPIVDVIPEIHRWQFFFISELRINGAMSQFYSSLRDIWKYLTLLSPWSNSYDPPPLWPIYPAALSGLWRPHDDVIVPLTSPPLPYVTIENNLVSIFPPSLLLVHRLALHNFSALCISSESLMAVSCLIHADIPSDNERDPVSGIFVYIENKPCRYGRFAILERIRLLSFDSIISFYPRWNFSAIWTLLILIFLLLFQILFLFFFFLSFLFTGLLVLSEIGNRLGWIIVRRMK